jgi:hypothetical protein
MVRQQRQLRQGRPIGSGVVWQNDGRFVDTFDPNGDETLSWQGPHDDLVYGFLGDTSVAQKLCTALA